MDRLTLIVEGPLAFATERAAAARINAIGTDILTFPRLAARLAGGFARPAGRDELFPALRAALSEGGFSELEEVATLPGTARAVAASLDAIWKADLSLEALASSSARLRDLLIIKRRIEAALPPGCLTPRQLRDCALNRIGFAHVLGRVALKGVVTVDPVWRPLLVALASRIPVQWGPPASVDNAWLRGGRRASLPNPPAIASAEVCAEPRSEAVEALRWARALLASGSVRAEEVAISATSTEPYDDHLLVLAREAGLPLHFSHGVPALSTRDGQRCAALADILVNGIDQRRVHRLVRQLPRGGVGDNIPPDWFAGLPRKAALRSLDHWREVLKSHREERIDGDAAETVLLPILDLLAGGAASAAAAGDLLSGDSLRLWHDALAVGPNDAIALSLETLRVPDQSDPANSVVWAPANHLAASPRAHTRLLGLNSRSWPRSQDDDAIVPDHILSRALLHPLSLADRDRLSFAVIAAATKFPLAMSRSKRSARGGLLTESSFWPSDRESVLERTRVPRHAFSESDRLLARPSEAIKVERIQRSRLVWRNWSSDSVTNNDGVLAPEHAVVVNALTRVQSATSLRRLLRDPLGYVWEYALGWKPARFERRILALDAADFGELVHELISRTVLILEPDPGFSKATSEQVSSAVADAGRAIMGAWPLTRSVPPLRLWRNTVDEAARRALRGFGIDETMRSTRSWTEVPFGIDAAEPDEGIVPWDTSTPIVLRPSGVRVQGRIDRVDLRSAGDAARVTDYKSGSAPERASAMVLNGGRELQRVLYATAVRQLLPEVRTVVSRLAYLGDESPPFSLNPQQLEAAEAAVSEFVSIVCTLLRSGAAPVGPDGREPESDLRLALPADFQLYARLKGGHWTERADRLTELWGMP